MLSEFFSPCGEIQNVRVIRDSITGIGKGFGYILFEVHSTDCICKVYCI